MSRNLLRPDHYDFWLQLLDLDENRSRQSAVMDWALAAWPQHLDFWELRLYLAPLVGGGQESQCKSGPELCYKALRAALVQVTAPEGQLRLWQCFLQVDASTDENLC